MAYTAVDASRVELWRKPMTDDGHINHFSNPELFFWFEPRIKVLTSCEPPLEVDEIAQRELAMCPACDHDSTGAPWAVGANCKRCGVGLVPVGHRPWWFRCSAGDVVGVFYTRDLAKSAYDQHMQQHRVGEMIRATMGKAIAQGPLIVTPNGQPPDPDDDPGSGGKTH